MFTMLLLGEAKEVSVAGEFNGWVTVPLDKEELSLEEAQLLVPQASSPPATLWTVLLQMEPGCYTVKFLVDGEGKTREEKGELNAIIVAEEDEDEEEATLEEVKAVEAVKEAVERVEEDLDVLTLNISRCGEKNFMEMTDKNDIVPQDKDIDENAAQMEIKLKEAKVEEKKDGVVGPVEAKMEVFKKEEKIETVREEATIKRTKEEAKKETVEEEGEKETVGEEAKVEKIMEAKIQTVKEKANVETIKEDPMVEPVEKANKVEDKENTPKVVKEAPPKRGTRRSILPGTPTLSTTPKVVKEAPPKRVTRRSILPGTPSRPRILWSPLPGSFLSPSQNVQKCGAGREISEKDLFLIAPGFVANWLLISDNYLDFIV